MYANFYTPTSLKNSQPAAKRQQIRIGDSVRSPRFGRGTVRGFGPDGALIVQFSARNQVRSVYPTLVERM